VNRSRLALDRPEQPPARLAVVGPHVDAVVGDGGGSVVGVRGAQRATWTPAANRRRADRTHPRRATRPRAGPRIVGPRAAARPPVGDGVHANPAPRSPRRHPGEAHGSTLLRHVVGGPPSSRRRLASRTPAARTPPPRKARRTGPEALPSGATGTAPARARRPLERGAHPRQLVLRVRGVDEDQCSARPEHGDLPARPPERVTVLRPPAAIPNVAAPCPPQVPPRPPAGGRGDHPPGGRRRRSALGWRGVPSAPTCSSGCEGKPPSSAQIRASSTPRARRSGPGVRRDEHRPAPRLATRSTRAPRELRQDGTA